MKRNFALIILGLYASFTSQSALAIEEQIKNYRGIRSAGMGGVITTTGNYTEALFGNPARHAEVDNWKWTILETTMEVNSNLITSTSDLSNFKGSSGSGTISSASKLIGQNQHLRAQFFTGYFNPKLIGDTAFAFGLVTSVQANLTVNYTTDIDNQIITDVGPAFGFAHKFLDDNLSIGMNVRLLYRVASEGLIHSLSFLTGSKLSLQNFGKQGVGADGDIGAYYHIPWEIPFMRLKLGASINNLLKSHYDEFKVELLKNIGTRPINNDRVLNFGMRMDFPDTWIFSAPLIALELQDLGDTTKRVSFFKKTHIGAETKLTRVLSLRAGLNQGYLSGGLGIDLPVLKLDFATYGEELSGNAGEWEDRRYLARISFEI